MPDAIPGTGIDPQIKKKIKPALKKLSFFWGRQYADINIFIQ